MSTDVDTKFGEIHNQMLDNENLLNIDFNNQALTAELVAKVNLDGQMKNDETLRSPELLALLQQHLQLKYDLDLEGTLRDGGVEMKSYYLNISSEKVRLNARAFFVKHVLNQFILQGDLFIIDDNWCFIDSIEFDDTKHEGFDVKKTYAGHATFESIVGLICSLLEVGEMLDVVDEDYVKRFILTEFLSAQKRMGQGRTFSLDVFLEEL